MYAGALEAGAVQPHGVLAVAGRAVRRRAIVGTVSGGRAGKETGRLKKGVTMSTATYCDCCLVPILLPAQMRQEQVRRYTWLQVSGGAKILALVHVRIELPSESLVDLCDACGAKIDRVAVRAQDKEFDWPLVTAETGV